MKSVFSGYYFLFFVAMASTQPFLSLYLSGRGLSSEQIGVLMAVGAVAGMFAQPLLGYVNDRATDTRRLLILSAIISPAIYALYALFHPYALLLVVAFFYAVVQSTGPIADAMAIQSGNEYGFSYGQVRLWGALSFAITTMVAGYVYHVIGISYSFVFYAGLSLILVFVARFLPRTPASTHSTEMLVRGVWNVAKNTRLMVFIGLCFVLATAITVNFTYLPLYFKALHYPLGWVGLNFTVAALVEVPLFYVSGPIIKKFGARVVIVIASAFYVAKYVLMGFAPPPALVIAIQVLDGVGYAFYWSAGVQIVANLSPKGRSATAQTLYGAVASSLSSIVGSVVGGWLLEGYGPKAMYFVNAGIGGIALLGYIIFARHRSPQLDSSHPVEAGAVPESNS
ncbi:MFS transporter [Alicyclobacillus acidiphilus]|uniref:MFS transporter n=1 Tax=Alicyclobacillus acidiphilus TaxID=182455 RepID=UPI000835E3A4|nr:MFS transporter [Alicyclobacillus acidiphilus]